MLMDVIKDEKVVGLVLDHQPSVIVGIVDKPGRRLGVEITTQDDVWSVCDLLYLWCIVVWYCGGCLGGDVCIYDCCV